MLKKGLPALLVAIGLGLVLVSLSLVSACASTGVSPPTGEDTIEGSEPTGEDTTGVSPPTGEDTIEGSEFKFNPVVIAVSQGDEVKITFKNVGKVIHNFVIDEFGVETSILEPGETATVEFTADQSGTFFFYCSIPIGAVTHRDLGMEGEITVN